MNVLTFSRTIIMYCYNNLAISSKTSTTVPSLYWTLLAKLSRESAFTRLVPSAVPSANSIVTNDLRVKFRKCRLLPVRYVKPRIVCKRNDVAFADEFVPLIHPFPLY